MRRPGTGTLLFLLLAAPTRGADEVIADIEERLARFAPVEILADLEHLPDSEREALRHLVEAAKLMQPIFLRQAWQENPKYETTLSGPAAAMFAIHVGLWDRIDGAPFVGDIARPDGAGFYPADMTKESFEAHLAAHPEDAATFRSLTTVLRRDADGTLRAVPYSVEYAEWLVPAAEHLRKAAAATANESLARFCRSRANAFLSDDYMQSDMDWMDLDGAVEITIGPYETYEDRLFGAKAAFEAFVTVADPDASAALARYKAELPAMERNLPIPDEHKNLERGAESPIRVVDVVYTAGDTRSGIQTIAFNLPNDERVREAKGSKKVLLRNVIHAKFDRILQPIAQQMLRSDQAALVDRDAFADEVLFHELSHGLGPGRIVLDGRETEVRLELKELYTPLEEGKADIMGMWNALFLMEKGLVDPARRDALLATYLAGLFRSIRFGTEEAHGKGVAIQFNFLAEKGAIVRDAATGAYAVESGKFDDACRDLVATICMLQATGDYAGTQALFERYGSLRDELAADLERIESVPVDILPIYAADSTGR